jgi:2-phospho-L-lactate guanylyltransferase
MRLDSLPTRSSRPASSAPAPDAVEPAAASARAAVVIPLRGFGTGGARLAAALSPAARADLARTMADRVAAAAGRLPVVVVSSAPEVVRWAEGRGFSLVPDPGDLDRAVAAGVAWCARAGFVRAVVAHADLPLAPPGGLERFAIDAGRDVVAIVPCHRDDGTPVFAVPTEHPPPFVYGPGSFRRHALRASDLGLGVRVVRDAALGFDLDVPDDLARLDEQPSR